MQYSSSLRSLHSSIVREERDFSSQALTATSDDIESFRLSKRNANPVHIEITKSQHYFLCVFFALVGVCQLMIWNMIVNCFVALQSYIYPGHVFSDILGGFEHGAALLTAIVMFKVNAYNRWVVLIGFITPVIFYILFPLVTQLLPGNENLTTAECLLSAICAGCGVCVGIMHVSGFAYAAIFPGDYVSWVAFGEGISGVYSFVIFEVFSETGVFDTTVKGQQGLIWVLFAFGAVTTIVLWIMVIRFLNMGITKEATIHAMRMAQELEESEFPPARSHWVIFKSCWLQAFSASFPLFITLSLFPGLGPYGWYLSYSWTSALNGVFQVMDFLTRYLPILGSWTHLSQTVLLIVVLIRAVVFIPLFELPYRRPDIEFLDNEYWLTFVMIIFTVSNGWMTSLGCQYTTDAVTNPKEKEPAARLLAISLLFWITFGVFFDKVMVLNPPTL